MISISSRRNRSNQEEQGDLEDEGEQWSRGSRRRSQDRILGQDLADSGPFYAAISRFHQSGELSGRRRQGCTEIGKRRPPLLQKFGEISQKSAGRQAGGQRPHFADFSVCLKGRNKNRSRSRSRSRSRCGAGAKAGAGAGTREGARVRSILIVLVE